MEEDNDVDIDSDFDDDDEFNSEQTAASVANMTEAERRAHHNKLERQRRDQIKESFSSLRDVVPTLVGEKVGKATSASRAKILQSATEYIQQMTTRNMSVVRDIGDLKKQNRELEQQVRAAERELATRNQPPDFQTFSAAFSAGANSDSSDDDHSSATAQTTRARTAAHQAPRPRKKIRPNNM
jgi:Max protein